MYEYAKKYTFKNHLAGWFLPVEIFPIMFWFVGYSINNVKAYRFYEHV
jgi:hypothetical protein